MNTICESISPDSIDTLPVVDIVDRQAICESSLALCFEDGALVMGDRVRLRIPALNVRCDARFLGAVSGESIMFVMEDNKVDAALFLLGRDVYCEHNSDDMVLVFKGKVRQFDVKPFLCLHLSYPSRIHRLDVARDVRFNVDRGVLLHNVLREDVGDVVTGKLQNQSQGGGLVVSRESVGFVGDEVEIFMMIPCHDRSAKLKLKAKVRHVRYDIDADRQLQFYTGLQFMDISYEGLICIKSYLFDNLKRVRTFKAQTESEA